MLHLILLIGILVAAVLAVWLHDLLAAAVGLSLASALLAVLFYALDANTAAIFELSVGAGLLAVLFISAISLVKAGRESRDARPGVLGRLTTLLIFGLVGSIFAYAARTILTHPPAIVTQAEPGTVSGIIWGPRAFDVLGQAIILFASMLGVILLFRTEESK